MHKHTIDYLIFFAILIVGAVVWWYTLTLLIRTNWAQQFTSIGNDVIIIMYILCAFVCVCSTYMVFKKHTPFPKILLVAVLILAFLPSAEFFYLNLFVEDRSIDCHGVIFAVFATWIHTFLFC